MPTTEDELRAILKTPCDHEAKHTSPDQTVADYHPLTYDQVKGLIHMAFNATAQTRETSLLRNQVQVRLGQAIEGQVCPHEIDGPVAQKQAELDETYVKSMRSGDESGAVRKIAKILNLKS